MSRPTLAIYQYLYNCVRIRYPFRESLQSALALADSVWACDCHSDDGTWEELNRMASGHPKLRVVRHPWGSHYSIQPRICNGLLEGILQGQEYAMLLQADEVLCEWSFSDFWEDLSRAKSSGAVLGRPFYRHFCPDFHTTWPFLYDRKAVLSRTASGARWDTGGDACSLVGFPTADLRLQIHHYGKVQTGRRREALHKELTFQELYRDRGFPDPKVTAQRDCPDGLDYRGVFDPSLFTPYVGAHPVWMAGFIADAEGRAGRA